MKQSITAYQKFIRQTPRKLRLVADLVRGQKVDKALVQLEFSAKRAAQAVGKVITQAKANAINNSHLNPESLVVSQIQIEEGPTFKRWRAVSRGRAHTIFKRSSHIKVIVEGESQSTDSKKGQA